MDISVVIGSYNQVDKIKRVIDGFLKQSCTCTFEVIVVDSNSTDDTKKFFDSIHSRGLSFELNFVQCDNPNGKSQARNVGVQLSKSEIIVVTDADMIPDSQFIQSHFDAHRHSNELSCFEGLAYNLDSYDWPPHMPLNKTQVPEKYKAGDQLDWYYFLTGNVSFPKSLFIVEGGFSEDFKNYGWEDLEFGYRLKKRDVPLYYLPAAINFHYHVITDEEKADRKYVMGQSAQIFINKHPELKTFLGLNPISAFLRRQLSKKHFIYRIIQKLSKSKSKRFQSFSYWFLGEYNYLSGLLNLSRD